MPVLIYERMKTTQSLRFFKRFKLKLVFLGKLNVAGIVAIGMRGYWFLEGTGYGIPIHEELMEILATARLDDTAFRVIDWYQNNGRLIIHVTKF
jgi:hypothetical protein